MAAPWVLRSNTKKTLVLSLATLVVGAFLIVFTQGKTEFSQNYLAAYWLGVIVMFVGAAGVIFPEDITVTVDRNSQQIHYELKSRRGSRRRVLPFASVESVNVTRRGRGSSPQTNIYSIALALQNGEHLRTGYWSTDESEVQATARELSEQIGCAKRGVPERLSTNAAVVLVISLLVGVLAWLVYYRMQFGPLGPAMWKGSAPPVAICAIAFVTYNILRDLRK
jgi:hypothetical protein